ncbi:MAG TPA: hypothetical protein V6C52_07160 [Coleofasciculaceae cyanobacterium]
MSIGKIPKRTSQRGYGLVLMMLFVATTVMVMLSLQMTTQTSLGQFMTATRNRMTAESMAKTGLFQARTQILTDLDAGTLNPLLDSGAGSPATWTYTSTVSVPSDPSNLGSAPVSVGSFTATITQWRAGGWYVVKSVGTVGGSSVTFSDLMEIQPSYTCSVQGAATESAILAGNIATLSDDDLIKYAQNNCMLKAPPAGIATYSVTAGTGTDCSSGTVTDSGSGTLNQGNTTGSCERRIQGTYSLVYLGSHTSSTDINIHNTSGGLTEVHATDISGQYHGIDAYNVSTASPSSSPLLLKLTSVTNDAFISSSTSDDTISITGNLDDASMYDGYIETMTGIDTLIVGGTWSGADIYMGGGDDSVYVKKGDPHQGGTLYLEDGNDVAYLGSFLWDNMYGGDGNDIISCTNVLGNGSCTAFGAAAYIYGEAGNDIISIDQMVIGTALGGTSNTILDGGTGNNIIYTKGLSDTTYSIDVNVCSGAGVGGGSLVISGGNRTKGIIHCSQGNSNNVLLLKTGTTSTNTTVDGLAFNDTQTSLGNFTRILWY